jgi:hypothetical protein
MNHAVYRLALFSTALTLHVLDKTEAVSVTFKTNNITPKLKSGHQQCSIGRSNNLRLSQTTTYQILHKELCQQVIRCLSLWWLMADPVLWITARYRYGWRHLLNQGTGWLPLPSLPYAVGQKITHYLSILQNHIICNSLIPFNGIKLKIISLSQLLTVTLQLWLWYLKKMSANCSWPYIT